MNTDVYKNVEIYVKIKQIVNDGCRDVFPLIRLNRTASINLERLLYERSLCLRKKGQVAYVFLYWQFKGDHKLNKNL